MRLKTVTVLPVIVLLTSTVLISLIFLYASPAMFVSYIGIKNGYFLMFFLALFSGISLYTGAPYVLIMITLVAGGINPFLLALVATVGDACGGTIAYSLGRMSTELAERGVMRTMQHYLITIAQERPRALPLAIFAYGCAAPFSNDVVTIPMGMLRYPFLSTMIPLQLGTFIYNCTIAIGGVYAYAYFFS